jgi:hypothetical protein
MVMNPKNSPDNRKFSDFKTQQKNQNGCPVYIQIMAKQPLL